MAVPENDAGHCSKTNYNYTFLSWLNFHLKNLMIGPAAFSDTATSVTASKWLNTCTGITAVVGFVRKSSESSNSVLHHQYIMHLFLSVFLDHVQQVNLDPNRKMLARSNFLGLPCCGVQPARLCWLRRGSRAVLVFAAIFASLHGYMYNSQCGNSSDWRHVHGEGRKVTTPILECLHKPYCVV